MSGSKLETEDIPIILATLKRAVESKTSSKIIIEIAKDGGVIGIHLESKLKVK